MGCCLTVRAGRRTVEACAVGGRELAICDSSVWHASSTDWTYYHEGIYLIEWVMAVWSADQIGGLDWKRGRLYS
jgi:hypothetical protein